MMFNKLGNLLIVLSLVTFSSSAFAATTWQHCPPPFVTTQKFYSANIVKLLRTQFISCTAYQDVGSGHKIFTVYIKHRPLGYYAQLTFKPDDKWYNESNQTCNQHNWSGCACVSHTGKVTDCQYSSDPYSTIIPTLLN